MGRSQLLSAWMDMLLCSKQSISAVTQRSDELELDIAVTESLCLPVAVPTLFVIATLKQGHRRTTSLQFQCS
jgi:hypothetical protein